MHLCQEAVVIVEPAGQRLGQFCSAGLQQAMTNPANTSGSRSPAISASIIRRPDAPLRGKIIECDGLTASGHRLRGGRIYRRGFG
jgi:hypothetical protein